MDPVTPGVADLLANEAFLRRLARSLSLDEASAEDLVQETWVAALQRRPAVRSLRGWLARVMRNRAVSLVRSECHRSQRERDNARAEAQPDTAALVERADQYQRLVTAVLALPENYRAVLLRHYLGGESVESVALDLGVPESTIHTRLRRARARLRQDLDESTFLGHAAWLGTSLAGVEDGVRRAVGAIAKHLALPAPLLASGAIGVGIGWGGGMLAGELDAPGATRPAYVPAADRVTGGQTASDPAPGAGPLGAPRPLSPPRHGTSPRGSATRQGPAVSHGIDLRALLTSPRRGDQIRAIELLTAAGTREARDLLFDVFLATDDAILHALIEEALLGPDLDVADTVLDAYVASADPDQLSRLAKLMGELSGTDPSLDARIVGLLVDSLRNAGVDEARLSGVKSALVAIGEAAIDPLAEYLADPHADPRGVGAATYALAHADASASGHVPKRLAAVFEALLRLGADESLPPERREALFGRTRAVAWAAKNRPVAEHDALGGLLAAGMIDAESEVQAQHLAWGLVHLNGIADERRQTIATSVLAAMAEQPDEDLRQSYAWAIGHLATRYGVGPIDESFHRIRELVENARAVHGGSSGLQLDWLLGRLDRYATEGPGH